MTSTLRRLASKSARANLFFMITWFSSCASASAALSMPPDDFAPMASRFSMIDLRVEMKVHEINMSVEDFQP
jgi:hypothetical protein